MKTSEIETTLDKFLGGKLTIEQPKKGYRAGIDPVLLAASVNAKSGQSILDLGCGVGVASLCLLKRIAGIRVIGIDLMPELIKIAKQNARMNQLFMEAVCGNILKMPTEIRSFQFDHVIMNPPYFDRSKTTVSDNQLKETSNGEGLPLRCWVTSAASRVKDKGLVHIIFRTERLPELLTAIPRSLGSLEVQPFVPRSKRDSEIFILKARKGGNAAFQLASPIILHEGEIHKRDADSYTKKIASILRCGAALKED